MIDIKKGIDTFNNKVKNNTFTKKIDSSNLFLKKIEEKSNKKQKDINKNENQIENLNVNLEKINNLDVVKMNLDLDNLENINKHKLNFKDIGLENVNNLKDDNDLVNKLHSILKDESSFKNLNSIKSNEESIDLNEYINYLKETVNDLKVEIKEVLNKETEETFNIESLVGTNLLEKIENLNNSLEKIKDLDLNDLNLEILKELNNLNIDKNALKMGNKIFENTSNLNLNKEGSDLENKKLNLFDLKVNEFADKEEIPKIINSDLILEENSEIGKLSSLKLSENIDIKNLSDLNSNEESIDLNEYINYLKETVNDLNVEIKEVLNKETEENFNIESLVGTNLLEKIENLNSSLEKRRDLNLEDLSLENNKSSGFKIDNLEKYSNDPKEEVNILLSKLWGRIDELNNSSIKKDLLDKKEQIVLEEFLKNKIDFKNLNNIIESLEKGDINKIKELILKLNLETEELNNYKFKKEKLNNKFENKDNFKSFNLNDKELNSDEKILEKILKENDSNSKEVYFAKNTSITKEIKIQNEIKTISYKNFDLGIMRNIKFMNRNSIKELTVKVYPKELGAITISLTQSEGTLKAKLKPTSKETYSLLMQQSNEIKKALEENQIKISNLDISLYNEDTTLYRNNDFSGAFNKEREKNSKDEKNSSSREEVKKTEEVEEVKKTDRELDKLA